MMGEHDNVAGAITKLVSPENLALLKRSDRFVIMAAGLVVVAALGAVAVLRDYPLGATVLAVLSMLVVAALVALVQWRAISMQEVEADLLAQSTAAAAVNGDWWQLVFAEDHPGLSYVSIAISEVAERHAMHGITYDADGRRCARWSSDAVAIKTSTPLELYYVWRGTLLVAEDATVISGLGRFRFDSVGREMRPMQGEGAFTRGSTTELNFGTPRAVELIRFTKEESLSLADDPSVLALLAVEAFKRFKLEKGRSFSEQRLLEGRENT